MGFGGSSTVQNGSLTRIKLTSEFQAQLAASEKLGQENTVGVVLALNSALYNPSAAVADIFASAAGVEASVDTGNTTLTHYSADKAYKNYGVVSVEAHAKAQTGHNATTTRTGVRATIGGSNVILYKMVKEANCTATKAYVRLQSDDSLVASADFAGNFAVFNCTLTAGVQYRFGVDAVGASYNDSEDNGAGGAAAGTLLTWNGGFVNNTSDNTYFISIESLHFVENIGDEIGDGKLLQTNALTALDGLTGYIRIIPYGLSLAAGASGQLDISLDGSTFSLTDQNFNEWIQFSGSLSNAKIKYTISKGSSTSLSEIGGYCVMVG